MREIVREDEAPGRWEVHGGRGPGWRAVPLVVALLTAGAGGAAGASAQVRDTIRGDTAAVLPLPELVVRALRAPLAAGALPYAVTVRRPSLGVPTSGLSLDQQLRAVPGLQVHSRYNDALGDRIVVRGFGARAQFGVRGVQVLVDGIPATMPDGQTTLNHLELALLDRAEVLRGPAAAAHGNAAGGVLLLTTRPPPDAGLRQEVAFTGGGGDLLRLRATTAGAHGPGGWIASLTREGRDGYRPHSRTERYQLTGRFDAPLAGGHLRAVAHGVTYDADNPGSLTIDQFREQPHQAQAFNVAQGTGEEGRHGQLGLAWERPLAGARVEATLYGLARTLENPIPPSIIDLDRRAGGARVLFRGATPRAAGGPDWAVGLDAAVQGDDRQNFENSGGSRGELTLNQAERVTNVAVHGQGMIPILDRLNLFLGARYDRVSFSADDRLIAADNPDDSGSRAMDAFSPTAGLRLELSRKVDVYGNVSTAFETPTTTELVNRPDGAGGFNQELEPQRTLSYELGTRIALAPALQVQAAAYHARVTDGLIPFEVASAPGRQFFRNAAEAVHQGVELTAELTTDRADLLGAYSRTDAEFASYTADGQSFDGNKVPGVRPWTAELLLTVRPDRRLLLQADYQATGEMVVDDANDARAPGYHLLGLRAAAPHLRFGRLEAEPFAGVDNVLDETYVASVVPNAFGGRYFEPGPGRTFYLGVSVAVVLERGRRPGR